MSLGDIDLDHPMWQLLREVAEMKRRAFRVTREDIMVAQHRRKTYNVSYLNKSQDHVTMEIEATNPDAAVGMAVTQASRNEGGAIPDLTFSDGEAQGIFKSLQGSLRTARPEGHLEGVEEIYVGRPLPPSGRR